MAEQHERASVEKALGITYWGDVRRDFESLRDRKQLHEGKHLLATDPSAGSKLWANITIDKTTATVDWLVTDKHDHGVPSTLVKISSPLGVHLGEEPNDDETWRVCTVGTDGKLHCVIVTKIPKFPYPKAQ